MKNPFSHKPPVTPIDPLHITAENAFMYSPDVAQPGSGNRLQRFWNARSKPQQVLLIAGVVTIVFSSFMIGLSFTVGNSGNKSLQSTVATNGSSGNGASDGSSTNTDGSAPSDDLNQNGIADEYEVDTASGEDVSWWQSLLNKMYGKTDTGSSSDSGDSGTSGDSSSGSGNQVVTNDDDESEYYLADGDTTSTDFDTSGDQVPASAAAQLATTGGGARFTVATWNVYTDNKQDIGDKTVTILHSAQVVGLQEVNSEKTTRIKRISCATCAYAAYLPDKADRFPIVWDKGYFTLVDAGYSFMSNPPQNLQTRYAVWVKLRNKTTGKSFYMINTHLPKGVEGNIISGMLSAYKTHMNNLVTLLKSKQKDNVSIFVTGDFNVNYRKDDCSKGWMPCARLGSLDIKSGWKITNLAGISSKQGTHSTGNRLIDYVFTWIRSDTTVNATYVVGGNKNGWGGSDHKPSFMNVTIK